MDATIHPRIDQIRQLEGKIWLPEGLLLAKLAAEVPADQQIVEIGSYRGKSACYLRHGALEGSGAQVLCVDLWTQHSLPLYRNAENMRAFEANIESLFGFRDTGVQRFQGASVDAAKWWAEDREGAPIGLLFIDACHDFQFVEADFNAWSPFVPVGGVVAFHDYLNARFGGGVTAFVDGFVATDSRWQHTALARSLVAFTRVGDDRC